MTLTVGSLFSGIGGIDLGLERAGMTVKWQSEIDPFACKVLKKHWPDIPNLGNIKTVDWSNVEPVDLIAGGYPCQPFSTAGKRQGENDPRHLWPYFRNAISAIRPRYALLENVRGHLSMGATTVIGDLAQIGYDCEWQIISAASVGAPHRRDRIIIVAYPQSHGQWRRNSKNTGKVQERSNLQKKARRSGGFVAHTDSSNTPNGRECENVQSQSESGPDDGSGSGSDTRQISLGGAFKDSSNVANSDLWQVGRWDRWNATDRNQVFSRRNNQRGTQSYEGWQWWETEPDVGRVANGVPSRVDRLRGLGNAVVPQVAEYVGRLILQSLG